jgi:hypothetical protein
MSFASANPITTPQCSAGIAFLGDSQKPPDVAL